MNKYAFSIVMCIMALTSPIQAADKLSINNFLISPGVTEKEFTIDLDNDNVYAGFQFDLYLTEGLTINTCIASQRLPKATALTYNKQEDGSYRILYADILNQNIHNIQNISGTSGTIITITVTASNEAALGDLTGYFKNVKLSKLNGEGPSYDEMPFPITVVAASKVTAKNYTRIYGDANPTFDYTVEGGSLYGTPTISCSATATSPVGTYPIVIEQGSVINDVVEYIEGTLTIEKAPLTIAAGTYTKKQGEAMPEFTLTYDGFKNGETKDVLTKQPDVTCDANEASAPGEYPITVSGAEAQNYDISYTNGTLIVENKKGDVNGDGSITAQDASLVLQFIAGKITISDGQTDAADVNGDSSITAQDASLILQYVAGKISF